MRSTLMILTITTTITMTFKHKSVVKKVNTKIRNSFHGPDTGIFCTRLFHSQNFYIGHEKILSITSANVRPISEGVWNHVFFSL